VFDAFAEGHHENGALVRGVSGEKSGYVVIIKSEAFGAAVATGVPSSRLSTYLDNITERS
jgi:hypothetical protein